jgi:uncharacterized protein YggL (DUF469 family)
MRKRLRKKKRVGEYTEWGRQFVITRNRRDGFDDFFDTFIEEAIETNGFYCGGGGKESRLSVVVELGRDLTRTDEKTNLIVGWLRSRPDVKEWRMGEVFDVWHDDYEDIYDGEIRVTAVV